MNKEPDTKKIETDLKNFCVKAATAGITPTEIRTALDNSFLLSLLRGGPQDWYQDIYDFHKTLGHYIGERPSIPPAGVWLLRCRLIEEEIKETIEALNNKDLEGIADGIGDSIVVLLGTAISYGIDMRPVWDEIHRTNMLKAGGPKRADGKALKPDGWMPPDIKGILEAQW